MLASDETCARRVAARTLRVDATNEYKFSCARDVNYPLPLGIIVHDDGSTTHISAM